MMNKKKVLLILGSISVLSEVVIKAKEKGYYVIVADYLPMSPAKKYADESWLISIDDVDSIVNKAIERHVDGIMNYCIDPAQKPYQKVCEILKLPCVAGYEQFDIMTNKDKFAECCRKYGLGTVPEYSMRDIDENNSIEFPVVMKPVDSRASKGLFFCKSKIDIKTNLSSSLSFSKRKKVIIQKEMKCPEVMIKYFCCDGEVFLTSMADIYNCYTKDGERVYMGAHIYPSKYLEIYLKEVNQNVINLLKGIGVKNGPSSLTAFFDNGVFRFFDSALRMGGGKDWGIVREICGIDISELLTDFAMNGNMGDKEIVGKMDKAFAHKKSIILYFNATTGVIGKMTGFEYLSSVKNVVDYHLCHKEGDIINGLGTSNNVIARVMIVCENLEDLINTINELENKINILDEYGNNMVAPLFDANEWFADCINDSID